MSFNEAFYGQCCPDKGDIMSTVKIAVLAKSEWYGKLRVELKAKFDLGSKIGSMVAKFDATMDEFGDVAEIRPQAPKWGFAPDQKCLVTVLDAVKEKLKTISVDDLPNKVFGKKESSGVPLPATGEMDENARALAELAD